MSPYTEQLALELRRLGIAGAPVERLLAELPQGLMLVEAPSGRILFSSAQVSHILDDEIAHADTLADSDRWEWKGLRDPNSRPLRPDEWPLARAIHRGEIVTAEELLMVHADGTRRWIRVSAAPLTALDGRIAAGIALFHDVTEQKDAEQRATALAKLAKRLGAARTAADVYRVIVDQGRRTLGAYAGGVVTPEGDEAWLQFIAAVGYPDRLLEEYRRFPADAPIPAALVLRTGEPLFLTHEAWMSRFRGPATASATKSIAVLPLRVEERTTAALTLSFDTPRRFPAAERLFMEALADHCGQALERALLYDAEREARATAEAANRVKDEFLAMISHDLRAPLNAMAGWAAVLRQRAGDDPALADAIGALQRSADVQVRLVNDLLDLSRAASGKLHISPEPVAAASVARSAVDAIRFAAAEKGVSVAVEIDDSAHDLVYADPARLQQMLGNLLSNAVKFTSKDGLVALTVRSAARNVAFTVTDTGAGIEPALLPFVFDRFRQAAPGRRDRDDGLGLGLAIVRHLVQVHGGVVYAHSRGAGTGAGFTLLLPLARSAAAGRGRSPHPEPQATLSGVDVLALLDDDAAAGIRSALEARGASIRTVNTATAAWQEVERCRPAAIVCDVTTAAIDGATFIRKLREAEAGSERRLAVAALMPGTLRPQRAASDLVGCNTLIPEPVDTEQLVLALQALAGTSEGATPLTIAAGDPAGALGSIPEGQYLA